MGAGRKTETIEVDTSRSTNPIGSAGFGARGLRKADLGGVVFGCKHGTISECLAKQIFGLPGSHITYVRNIEPGLPLFLFNYSDRMLHGIYEAASQGEMNIDPYGWTEDGKERTSFPAQVRICIKMYCQPIPEKKFEKAIKDNYYSTKHFYFELDHMQTKHLMPLFMPTPQPGKTGFSTRARAPGNSLPGSTRTAPFPFKGVNNVADSKKESKSSISSTVGNKYSTLWEDEGNSSSVTSKTSNDDSDNNNHDGEPKELVLDWELSFTERCYSEPSDACHKLDGESQILVEHESKEEEMNLEKERIVDKLQKLLLNRNSSNPSPQRCNNNMSVSYVPEVATTAAKQLEETEKEHTSVSEPHPVKVEAYIQFVQEMKELKARTIILERKQIESERELEQLRKIVMDSDWKIQQLNECVKELETKLYPSIAFVEDSLNEPLADRFLGSEKSIYLIGGYDGSSWLNSLDSYSPSLDLITPLRSMNSTRSYAAATALNDCLYVFGGGDGELWYDTVECYNTRNDEWTLCPSLARGKGSLAGATLNGKIFAIGGGNGRESFSDVEMFDPALGRWINCQPMLQKRFAPAAAEFNGVLYAVGGYDGQDYLKSVERLDPREAFWTRLPFMTSRRGCHSLAVFNEKLYALGGYNGENMVSSVEMFDPRAGSWVPGEAMHTIRGYAASAIVGDSLFLIGGLRDAENFADAVECYQEGAGWTVTSLKAIGVRCFFSAIVL